MMAGSALGASSTVAASQGPGGLLPLVILLVAVAFEIFCLVNLARAAEVRYLPRWAWAVITLVSIPLGGIIYLVVGQPRSSS